jgi:hypothetical protein
MQQLVTPRDYVNEWAAEAKRLHAAGFSYRQIARRLGVSRSTISGRLWHARKYPDAQPRPARLPGPARYCVVCGALLHDKQQVACGVVCLAKYARACRTRIQAARGPAPRSPRPALPKTSSGARYCPPVGPIAQLTAHIVGIHLVALRSESRLAMHRIPRHLSMWVGMRLGCSYLGMGRYFGQDHTTIRNGCRGTEARRLADPEFAALADKVLAAALAAGLDRRSPPLALPPVTLPPPEARPLHDEPWKGWDAFARQDDAFRQAMLASGGAGA